MVRGLLLSTPIVGYNDRLTVEPGQTVDVKVSCAETGLRAPGRRQVLQAGSYVRIPHRAGLTLAASFSIHLWMWINTSASGRLILLLQGVVVADGDASCLEAGRIAARVGDRVRSIIARPVRSACRPLARTMSSSLPSSSAAGGPGASTTARSTHCSLGEPSTTSCRPMSVRAKRGVRWCVPT
jgi:hypothetical protein